MGWGGGVGVVGGWSGVGWSGVEWGGVGCDGVGLAGPGWAGGILIPLRGIYKIYFLSVAFTNIRTSSDGILKILDTIMRH